ncbi:hypothetical protein [Streptomyces viridochromogenes]|uniref:hypothetical protein n=1 Tax=Streptomyces viridochromogenes TaxID=1938 RepID=UPI001FCC4BED|nr:hypothetical protein [Streptomyces viridochromogenes]
MTLRQGPAAEPGTAPAWFAFLRPAHSEGLPDWPATVGHTDKGLMLDCGTILDFRPADQLLQSHADLWLTPMTGVQPPARNDVDVLDRTYQVLDARLEASTDSENDPLQSVRLMVGMARGSAAEGNLFRAAHSLTLCESLVQRL